MSRRIIVCLAYKDYLRTAHGTDDLFERDRLARRVVCTKIRGRFLLALRKDAHGQKRV